MVSKFYLDTSVWRDYFEDRKDNIRPLGEFAFRFLNYCKKNNFTILYSPFVIEELLTYYSKEKVKLIFENYKEQLVEVFASAELKNNALMLRLKLQIPWVDAVHALLAKENNAFLISRDRHFEKLQNIAEVRLPEEFI